MRNQLTGFYTGCINSGNTGDDILWPICTRLLADVFQERFSAQVKVKELPFGPEPIGEWLDNADLGIIGGGSIIHPEELSYTEPPSRAKVSLLFGTGISDSQKYMLGLPNIEKILRNEPFAFPINGVMQKNVALAHAANFGGLRGPLDNVIAKQAISTYDKPFIYDPGLLAGRYLHSDHAPVDALFNIESKKQRLMALNLALVTSTCRIGRPDQSIGEYNHTIHDVLKDVALILLEQGYSVLCCPMSGTEVHLHQTLVRQVREARPQAKIHCAPRGLTYEEVLSIYSAARFSIGTRLHANILSASVGTPPINLMYGYKGINFAESIKMLSASLPTHTLSVKAVMRIVRQISQNPAALRLDLRKHIDQADILHRRAFNQAFDAIFTERMNPSAAQLLWDRGDGISKHIGRFLLRW